MSARGESQQQEPSAGDRLGRVLRVLVAATSVLLMLLFVIAALRRLHYPYEIEELEGYMYLSALRVFRGQTVYPRPSMQFIPYMYPPGYYYAVALVGRVMGMSLATLRMTSLLSTLGCFLMLGVHVWSEVKRWLPALAAAGLYAGCYVVCEEWFDLARLDSFFILLLLIALYATRRWPPVLAALLWIATFQTKQSILPFACLMLCANWRDRRGTLAGLLTFLAGAGTSVFLLNRATDGWYSFYVFAVPKANADIQLRAAVLFLSTDLLRPLALALFVVLAAFLLTRPHLGSRATRFYLVTLTCVPLFWWIRTHAGSASNALMPVYAILAILFGLALSRLLDFAGTLEPRYRALAAALVLSAVLAQEAAGLFNPGDYLPGSSTRASLATTIHEVNAIPGDVLVFDHPYYGLLAGKPATTDIVSFRDALHAATPEVRASMQHDLASELEEHRFNALLLNHPMSPAEFEKLTGPGSAWRSFFNVEQTLPDVEIGAKPEWLQVHCPPEAAPPCPVQPAPAVRPPPVRP